MHASVDTVVKHKVDVGPSSQAFSAAEDRQPALFLFLRWLSRFLGKAGNDADKSLLMDKGRVSLTWPLSTPYS